VLHRVVVRRLAPVVVTLRSGEPALDTVTALWKDEYLPRLELAALDAATTAVLVARVLGGPVESASAHRMWTLTEGVPLLLRHLLPAEVSSARFTSASGIWRWTSEPKLSAQLTGLLEREIGDLPAGVLDVVDVVALAEPVAIATLSALTSPVDVEHAESRGLVRIDGLVARLAHPLYGEIRRAAMGSLRARRVRGQVAQTLDRAADLIPRAVLTLNSDLPPDPGLFLAAAQAATAMYDLPLAERLARGAAETGNPAALLVHAAALSWLSRGEEAEAILAALAEGELDPATRAMVHVHRTGNLFFTMARPEEARQALSAAEATGALPVHVAGMSLALSAGFGNLRLVLERGTVLLRAELPDPLARILISSAVAAAAAVTGEIDLVDEAAEVGGFTADRVPTVIPGFGLADFLVLGHRLHGTPSECFQHAERLLAASTDLPGPARLMGLVVAGHAALASGQLRHALILLGEAWAGLADSRHEFRFRCRTLLATALAQAGQPARAAPLVARLTIEHHPAYWLFLPDDLLAQAWAAAAQGSTTEAVRHASAAAALARDIGAPAYEVIAWQTAVQLGDATAALPRLTELTPLGPRAELARLHAAAWAAQDGQGLLEVADAWERHGDLVAAGDAAAQAAQLHRRHGRQGSALSAAAIAAKLADRSGASTPALAAAARPLPLTPREREIAQLAARGHSNKSIAEQLTVSVRTVEGHLYRVNRKLGVTQRNELAKVLGIE